MVGGRLDIPTLGLGTYRITDHDECVDVVGTALDIGYRHIDTAEAYRNEAAVGTAIAESDLPREDLFIGTKVLHPKFTDPDGYTRRGIVENVHACLDRLGVERVDLLYGVHWPEQGYDPEETFAACAQLVEAGKADHLGVCNLTPALVDEARAHSSVPIEAIQVEMHPLLPQRELRRYCDDHDMSLVAYGPLGNGAVLEDPLLEEIADEYGVSVAQVSLAWIRSKGAHAIPKATSSDHLRDNWGSLELELDDEAIRRIDDADRNDRQYDPEYAPAW